jgi:hypothetical protein
MAEGTVLRATVHRADLLRLDRNLEGPAERAAERMELKIMGEQIAEHWPTFHS